MSEQFDRCVAPGRGRERCWAPEIDHVHQPLPCPNGQDEAHHDFLPPVAEIAEYLRRMAPRLTPADRSRLTRASRPAEGTAKR